MSGQGALLIEPMPASLAEYVEKPASARESLRRRLLESELKGEVPILMYHSIADHGPAELAPYRLTPAAFTAQMNYLADHGYYSISLQDWADAMAQRRWLPGRPVAITFDDGYVNFLEHAWPALESAGLTATMFVVTDKVGQTADWDVVTGDKLPLMSWPELRALVKRGLVVGSHTAKHPSLLKLSTEQIIEEGMRSRRTLNDELGADVRCFAYPYGHLDERVRRAISQAGYDVAVQTLGGISTVLHDPLRMPRIEIFPSDDLDQFAAKISCSRPRLSDARLSHDQDSRPVPDDGSPLKGSNMRIHPDYALKLTAQLESLVGDFVALHSKILTAGGSNDTLQSKLVRLFRQPLTGKVRRRLNPLESIGDDVRISFEPEASVTLDVEPKQDHGASPESCLNSLIFHFTGPSRWLSFEFTGRWADLGAAQRYQLGLYATTNRDIAGRVHLRLKAKDGGLIDSFFADFALNRELRCFNSSGALNLVDLVNVDMDQPPTLIISLETPDTPDLIFRLNYLSAYFD